MRWITLVLAALLVLVHAELWFGKGGVPRMVELQRKLDAQRSTNELARRRNEQLAAEVSDLKEGLEMVEEKARSELGMVRPDELLVVLTPAGSAAAAASSTAAAGTVSTSSAGTTGRAASGASGGR